MVAAWATDERTERLAGATVALSIDYVAPARATEVRAEALVVRRGRALCFCEATARAGGEVVAKALATYRFG
jgi:acyl-coenzyme A thioesterase PaaI-like protein